ncbi:MAG: hypothetical protein HUJ29_01995 [Gammaproteobacteria bacterium]|nr:hypothetical protein [Gammaproteobacteria bacterium]
MKKNHLIMGSAIGLAAIAVAIDHTRHSLPQTEQGQELYRIEGQAPGLSSSTTKSSASPCALDGSPCSLGN